MESANFSWDVSRDKIVLPREKSGATLNDEILISNIRWFIVFRWVAIGLLVFFQILVLLVPDMLTQLGIVNQQSWPLILTLILTLANLSYIYALDHCQSGKYNSPSIILWVQIIVDLICLSFVEHFIGSTATPAPFFYVLHITLACIFFSTKESFVVAVLVCVMYTTVLLVEDNWLVNEVAQSAQTDLQLSTESTNKYELYFWMITLNSLFLVIWYVVSRLSIVDRTHQNQLLEAYKQLNQAQVEKDQYALLMTHQLKSPLDAIRSKINLIKAGYCGESSLATKEALVNIDNRATTMSGLILDLLRLERLKATCLDTATFKAVSIKTILRKCIDKLALVASAKQIDVSLSIEDFIYNGIPDQLEILLENIISNAITYSYDKTSVVITSSIDKLNHTASVAIIDHGIGIDSKELPNIFNEYFYSPRATLHNMSSSGIGLSIVKKAAENNKLQINVTSAPGAGTTFTVVFKNIQLPEVIAEN